MSLRKRQPFSSYTNLFFQVAAFILGLIISLFIGFKMVVTNLGDGEVTVSNGHSSYVAMSSSLPVRLRVPAITLDVPFSTPLGIANDGEIEVPDSYEMVGWYQFSPTPGVLGPAVVLGHVDSWQGPAVFFSLGRLDQGDDIFIDREDGSIAHFIVEKIVRHDQTDFPTADVYGDIPYAGLRLVTCTGTYDRSIQRYTQNLIVYAKLNQAI